MVRPFRLNWSLAAWAFVLPVLGYCQALELSQLERSGLGKNRELQLLRQEIETQSTDTLNAFRVVNPHLEIEALHSAEEPGRMSGGVRVSREFRPGDRDRQQKAAKADWDARRARLVAMETEIVRDIRIAFHSWQILKRKAALQREVIGRWEGISKLTAVLVAQGRLSEVDLAEAQLNAVRARQAELGLFAEIEAMETRLRLLTGQAHPPRELAHDAMDSLPSLPALDTLLSRAKSRNPVLAALRLEKSAGRLRLAVEKGLIAPAFTLSAGYEREVEGDNMIGAGIALPLPLFNRNQAGVAKAGSSVREADMRLSVAEGKLETEVRELSSRLGRMAERYALYNGQIRDLGRKQVGLAEKGFRQGLTGIFDLSRVQKEALEQELDGLDLLRDYYLAFNELVHMAGGEE